MSGRLSQTIGGRGERIAELLLTNYKDFGQPLFDSRFLGEQKKHVDYYVEFALPNGERAFFLAQIKSTTGPAPTGAGLQIRVPCGKWNALVRYRCPVYVIAVHEPSEAVFIAAAIRKRRTAISRLAPRNELRPTNLKLLYDEVAAYWLSRPRRWTASRFKP